MLVQLSDHLIPHRINRGEHPARGRHEIHVCFRRAEQPWFGFRLAAVDPLTPQLPGRLTAPINLVDCGDLVS